MSGLVSRDPIGLANCLKDGLNDRKEMADVRQNERQQTRREGTGLERRHQHKVGLSTMCKSAKEAKNGY